MDGSGEGQDGAGWGAVKTIMNVETEAIRILLLAASRINKRQRERYPESGAWMYELSMQRTKMLREAL
jgi:hypothetical protein